MPDIITKIKSRGFWRLVVHPAAFEEKRFARLGELVDAVRELRVSLRGWDFPHFDRQTDATAGNDYVQQVIDWSGFVELWRYYQSGQFVALKGVWEDWREQEARGLFSGGRPLAPKEAVDLLNVVYTISEFFLFASRLALQDKLTDRFVVMIDIRNTNGRKLVSLDPTRYLFGEYACTSQTIEFSETYTRSAVCSNIEGHVLRVVSHFFERFGWYDFNGESFTPLVRDYINGRRR